jgi:hypothetical protein
MIAVGSRVLRYRSVPSSTLSLLGLVRHMADGNPVRDRPAARLGAARLGAAPQLRIPGGLTGLVARGGFRVGAGISDAAI